MTAKKSTAKKQIFEPYTHGNGRATEVVIAPSVLSCDFSEASRELAKCRRAKAPWVHIDVMDGHFVPNITFGPPILKKWAAAQPDLFYDTHLMIEKPMLFAEKFAEAGSSLINIHIETTNRARRDLRAIRRMGVKCGLTIKPKTPIKAILPFLDEVDMVLVMTVEPGFGGQAMMPKCLNKVRELALFRQKENLAFRLQIDGGVHIETASMAAAAGADVLVAGSAVFKGGNISENLKALRESLARAHQVNRA